MNNDEAIKAAKDQAQAVADEAARVWDSTKEKAGEALQSSERYIRDHPGTSVLGVFGAGLLVGAIVGWTLAHEERDDYSTSAYKYLKRLGRKLNLD